MRRPAIMAIGAIGVLVAGTAPVAAQPPAPTPAPTPAPSARTAAEQAVVDLSRDKWRWMADRDMPRLERLFHEDAVFVHMGGSMTRDRELEVIRTGRIQYSNADIQDVSVSIIDDTAILLNRIRLTAVVGGNQVVNPFVVTEVYVCDGDLWTLGSLSFTRLLGD